MVRDFGQVGVGGLDHSVNAAAGRVVDERVVTVPERISDVDDVGVGEVHIDVAVGVSGRVVFERDLLAVEIEGALGGENIAWNRTRGRSQKGKIPALNARVYRKMLPSVLMGKNCRTYGMQPFIPVRVVEVPVRVVEVSDGIGANACKS